MPQGDFEGAANAIISILTDVELGRKMSLEARDSINEFLSIDVVALWESLFFDLLTSARVKE